MYVLYMHFLACPYQAQHPDASEWIQSYWGGQWGSIHVWGKDKRSHTFQVYQRISRQDSSYQRLTGQHYSPAQTLQHIQLKVWTEYSVSYLLWKWLWLSCGETAAMCTGVHFPTMHRHVAVSLLHCPPVLLLQEQKKGRKADEWKNAWSRFQVCLVVDCVN